MHRRSLPPVSLTPEAVMGDLFQITRSLAPVLSFLSGSQIIRLREEAALFAIHVKLHVGVARRYGELISTLRTTREPVVLSQPSQWAHPSVATPTERPSNGRPAGTRVVSCPECHRRFEARRPTHIYCSAKCRYGAWDRAHPRTRDAAAAPPTPKVA